jgi:hypothetical protein
MLRGHVEAREGARDIRSLSSDNEHKEQLRLPHTGGSQDQSEWQWSIA